MDENTDVIRQLFAQIPEVAAGVVEIKSIARNPGIRTKVALLIIAFSSNALAQYIVNTSCQQVTGGNCSCGSAVTCQDVEDPITCDDQGEQYLSWICVELEHNECITNNETTCGFLTSNTVCWRIGYDKFYGCESGKVCPFLYGYYSNCTTFNN